VNPIHVAFAAVLIAAAAPADARSAYAGRYRVVEGPDVAGGLELRPDGRFAYVLIAGALDEHAEGRWSEEGGVVRLTTEPKPLPPVFARARDGDAEAPTLLVTFAGGGGIPGIDFRLGLADGSVAEGYTQEGGWSFAAGSAAPIRWVELVEPIHGLASPRFAIDPPATGALTFVLTPNDIEVVDFAGAPFQRRGKGFVLGRGDGELRLVRIKR
jgi:hypothetical protein